MPDKNDLFRKVGTENVDRALAGLPEEILAMRPEELSLMVCAMIAKVPATNR